MDNEFKKNQNTREFQDLVANTKYNEVAKRLIEKVYTHKVRIGFINIPYSKTQTGDYGCIITIKKKPQYGDTVELLFDVMHELGHCLDPIKLLKKDEDKIELRRERELRAWQFADEEFGSHPELKELAPEYADYKAKCLATYWAD